MKLTAGIFQKKNISLTNGSQSGFFYLFNLLAGKQPDGSHKKVLLPIAPEYIGYGDAGIDEDIFISYHPEIELLDNGLFKYHVDFEQLTVDDSVAAICASRPTNQRVMYWQTKKYVSWTS